MNTLKSSIAALALLAAVAGQAQAADSTPDNYAAMGFYLRGDIGWSFLEWSGGEDDNGLAAGIGAGYQFNDQIRADLRYDWAGTYDVAPGAEMDVSTVLGNLYFDMPTDTMFTPYLGAGVGYGWGTVKGGDDKDGLAFSLMAGTGISLSENMEIDVGYRFREIMTDGANPMEHQVLTGVRFKF